MSRLIRIFKRDISCIDLGLVKVISWVDPSKDDERKLRIKFKDGTEHSFYVPDITELSDDIKNFAAAPAAPLKFNNVDFISKDEMVKMLEDLSACKSSGDIKSLAEKIKNEQ